MTYLTSRELGDVGLVMPIKRSVLLSWSAVLSITFVIESTRA